jgi:hypothetical protein
MTRLHSFGQIHGEKLYVASLEQMTKNKNDQEQE